MKTIRAKNVEEAIALATQFKQEGKYNWFRGQLREWNPSSSLERRLDASPDAYLQFTKKLNRFLTWSKSQTSLAYLVEPENVDALFAVLQHYGLPTLYIDFTTEPSVAGFFSSDSPTPPEEPGNCVIYCLNTTDLAETYRTLNQPSLLVEPVIVDVPNLWRLQSQRGCFLFANHKWHLNYKMDRIIFPWSGPPAFPSREQIYPFHKSALEHLLDQYFFNEMRLENQVFFRKMLQSNKSSFLVIDVDELSTTPNSSSASQNAEHWSSDILRDWHKIPTESFDSTVGRQIPIHLRTGGEAPDSSHQIQQAICSALNWKPELRTEAVAWSFTGLPNSVSSQHFADSIRAAWNGMRNLPFTNDDIAAAFSALMTLCSQPDCWSFDGRAVDQAFTRWIPDAVHVEIGNSDGSYSRAYCSNAKLLDALTSSWTNTLSPPERPASITSALCLSYNPRQMFDFRRLSKIFAREMIPSQLAMRRPLVLFNPADLEKLCLP